MVEWIRLALRPHFHLAWNLFLALVPLVLSLWLFRRNARRGLLWWPLLAVFIVFLPNAAYTLTDVIHFVQEVRAMDIELPPWSVIYVVIPKYLVFFFIGFQAHVISLVRAGNYLRSVKGKSWVVPAELVLNFLCAVGVYWGRYLRFNSWELVTDPKAIEQQILNDISSRFSMLVIGRYFIVITALYYLVKLIDLAVWEYLLRRMRASESPTGAAA